MKEAIKNKLIKLIDTTDEEAIKYIDMFLDEPFIKRDLDFVSHTVYCYKDRIKEFIKSYEFIDDRQKVSVVLTYIHCCIVAIIFDIKR